ncbi:unnamed protein product [Wickerhamomyces anomalus]
MLSPAFEALKMDNQLPLYDQNTSDEDEELDEIDAPEPLLETPLIRSLPATPIPQIQESNYISSNFIPTDDNIIYGDDYVIFGLRNNQNLIIRGQFKLDIQRGAITINNVIYHSNTPTLKFLNPQSNALPLISATQVVDRSKTLDIQTTENQHLFSSDYKSVIKISNLNTGLEEIGQICPLFKNLFWNFNNNFAKEDLDGLSDFELAFNGYSFFPIIRPDNSVSIIKFKNWLPQIESLTSLYKENQLLKILVIGSKNCGKSTFLRLLLQNLLSVNNQLPVNILDLDPGQAEYSLPDSVSLNQPIRYNSLVSDLINKYNSDGLVKNESLLINTPGWIKGYGTELTNSLISKINPTHIIYLNPGSLELDELSIKGPELIPLLGNYQTSSSNASKYSSSQLRILKILSYLHKQENFKFDFKPLLFSPPLQVSYGNNGIKGISVLGLSEIHKDDVKDILEGTIVAIHTITRENLDELNFTNIENIPIIDSSELVKKIAPEQLSLKSLALIHSIDEKNKLINLYTPPFANLNKSDDEEYILIRGRTEVPIWELASNPILKHFKKQHDLPFITFEKNSTHDKVWKVRKNVHRRGQQ